MDFCPQTSAEAAEEKHQAEKNNNPKTGTFWQLLPPKCVPQGTQSQGAISWDQGNKQSKKSSRDLEEVGKITVLQSEFLLLLF